MQLVANSKTTKLSDTILPAFTMVAMYRLVYCSVLLSLVTGVTQQESDSTSARWETEVAALEKLQATEPIRNGIVFYGSSSIRLWNSIADDMAPWPVIKRGFGGAKLPDAIYYADRLLGPHLGADNPNRCKAVAIFVANDISGFSEDDVSAKVVGERFARLLAWIRKQDANIPVFWIEVTPTESRWKVWSKIQAATQAVLIEIDKDPNTWFIPTSGAFLGPDQRPLSNLFKADQLHLNQSGYQIWSALIKSQLNFRLPQNLMNKDTSNEGDGWVNPADDDSTRVNESHLNRIIKHSFATP